MLAAAASQGPIFYIPFSIPFAYWMDRPGGVRGPVIASMALVAVGAALRYAAPSEASPTSLALLHLGYVLNDIAGPVAMSAVSKIAEAWFPVSQRGIATALAAEANNAGSAFAFLVGPALLAQAGDRPAEGMNTYHALCLALALATLACAVAYWPSHPPSPPSHSAATAAASETAFTLAAFGAALRSLARNPSFLLLCAGCEYMVARRWV